MPARLNWHKVRACDGTLTAAAEPEETLVHDARAGVTPAQMVEHKLMALLKNSDAGAFTRSSELIDVQRKQKALFQRADAIQEGRQRAADRRIEDSARHEETGVFSANGEGIDVRVRTGGDSFSADERLIRLVLVK